MICSHRKGFLACIVLIKNTLAEPKSLTVFKIISMLVKGYILKLFLIDALTLTYAFIIQLINILNG
jgi:hypothetical protein